MLRFRLFLIVLISALLVSGSIALWAVAKEEKVPLPKVPKVVIDAVNEAVPGGEVTEAEMETDDDVVIYDVKKVVDGVEYELEVTADGDVREIEKGDAAEEDDEEADSDEDEEEVPLTDVPAKVLEAAKKVVPNCRIVEVDKDVENGATIYDVEVAVIYGVEVTADGKVLEIEIEDSDDEEGEDDEDDDEDEDEDDD